MGFPHIEEKAGGRTFLTPSWLKCEPPSQLPAPACCQGLWSDFPTSNPEVGEQSRNHGLAKVGIPAQAFYEMVVKGHRLEFQPISSVSIPTRCVDFHTLDHVESTDFGSFAAVSGGAISRWQGLEEIGVSAQV